MKDIIYITSIVALILLSGERQQDLRRRLEAEQQFSETLATEINYSLEKGGWNKPQ